MRNTCLNKNGRPLETSQETLHKRGGVEVILKDKCCAKQKAWHVYKHGAMTTTFMEHITV